MIKTILRYYVSGLLLMVIIGAIVGVAVGLYIVIWNVDPSFLEPMIGPYYEMIEMMKGR